VLKGVNSFVMTAPPHYQVVHYDDDNDADNHD